jgi:hypothetical protein
MWFKFVSVGLLLLSYNIITDLYISNMICDVQSQKETLDLAYRLNVHNNNPNQKTDIINYYNPKQNTDIINYYNAKKKNESFMLKGDIEEGLGECDVCNRRVQIPNIYQKNYLIFKLISNMSYKIMRNVRQIVCKHVNYFYPSSIKKEIEFSL